MSVSTTTPSASAVSPERPAPAAPSRPSPFFGRLTGVALVVSPVLFAAGEFLNPESKSQPGAQLDEWAAHRGALVASSLLSIAVALTLLVGLLALVRSVRGRGERLARVGGLVAGYGLVTAHAALGGVNLIFSQLVRPGVDRPAATTILDLVQHHSAVGAPLLLGHVALVVGLILLAIGLLRAHVAPRWAAVCLLLAPVSDVLLSGLPVGEAADVVSNLLLLAGLGPFGLMQLRRASA